MTIIEQLARELNRPAEHIENVVRLLDEGNTIPFIARYRKELHGAMDDTSLRTLEERLQYLRGLEERREAVKKSIDEQGKLTDELAAAIDSAQTLAEVEDLYRPYKQKRRPRATVPRKKGLEPLAKDDEFVKKFAAVKKENKERFSRWIYRHQGIELDPTMMFDVQVKRLHEYKRQLLNALHILVLYNRICDDPNYTMVPRTFIFGAKAAPGYRRAKEIIHFINVLAAKVASHERASKMIRIVFLQNYNVSTAEMLIPASEVSEQLSTASKEASGTGNMKFMMNGAVTIGTLDGANVEIADLVGEDNCYIFGMRSNEVEALYAAGTYRSLDIYETNAELRRALNMMFDGSLTPENPKMFEGLYRALVFSDNGGMADPYLVLKDFGSYQQAQSRLGTDYLDQKAWTRKEIINVAKSGIFSSDRTIREYNDLIWHLTPLTKKH